MPGMFCDARTACQNSPAVANRSVGLDRERLFKTASSASLVDTPNAPRRGPAVRIGGGHAELDEVVAVERGTADAAARSKMSASAKTSVHGPVAPCVRLNCSGAPYAGVNDVTRPAGLRERPLLGCAIRHDLGDAEVEHLDVHLAARSPDDEEVRGLDVAVRDAAAVRHVERRRHRLEQRDRLLHRPSSAAHPARDERDAGSTTPDGQWLPYMVLEWLDGKPLDIDARAERAAWASARRRAADPRGRSRCSSRRPRARDRAPRGIAHRDIKPANIFVIGDARRHETYVKVLDFGIAKVVADPPPRRARSPRPAAEITAFTPSYGAPEQFSRTHGATGPWTDVFAIALIFAELLVGGAPALEGDDFIQLGIASRDPSRRPTPARSVSRSTTGVEAILTRRSRSSRSTASRAGEFWRASARRSTCRRSAR